MTIAVSRFRVRVARPRNAPYYRVLIFDSREAMIAFYDKQRRLSPGIGRASGRNGFLAQCNGWEAEYRGRKKTNCVGQVLFYKGQMGAGIVSHEMTHAAHYWLGQRWNDYRSHYRDEKLAWVQGWLVSQFWRNFFRLGLDGNSQRTAK